MITFYEPVDIPKNKLNFKTQKHILTHNKKAKNKTALLKLFRRVFMLPGRVIKIATKNAVILYN
jgi:hypothetical protein